MNLDLINKYFLEEAKKKYEKIIEEQICLNEKDIPLIKKILNSFDSDINFKDLFLLCSRELKDNFEVSSLFIKRDTTCLEYCSDNLKNNESFIKFYISEAIKQNDFQYFEDITKEMRNNQNFIIDIIKTYPKILEYKGFSEYFKEELDVKSFLNEFYSYFNSLVNMNAHSNETRLERYFQELLFIILDFMNVLPSIEPNCDGNSPDIVFEYNGIPYIIELKLNNNLKIKSIEQILEKEYTKLFAGKNINLIWIIGNPTNSKDLVLEYSTLKNKENIEIFNYNKKIDNWKKISYKSYLSQKSKSKSKF